jgi:hypothetical protein
MSSDEFDPFVERLFARTPQMADATAFAAGVETRLASGSRYRTLALALAGVIGGVIAVRESLHANLGLAAEGAPVAGHALKQGMQTVGANAGGAIQGFLDQFGLTNLSLGSMGGMQLFWITTGAVVALAAAGVVKLSQEA